MNTKANANLIVHAVNSIDAITAQRDALLEALRACITEPGAVGLQEGLGRQVRRIESINSIARATIAAVEKESGVEK